MYWYGSIGGGGGGGGGYYLRYTCCKVDRSPDQSDTFELVDTKYPLRLHLNLLCSWWKFAGCMPNIH